MSRGITSFLPAMHPDPRIATLLQKLASPALPEIALGLARMHALLSMLGDPQRRLPAVIHIAGTNGKGSTLAFLQSMYQAAGYRVHTYSSPHLLRFNERIVLAGTQISDATLLELLQEVAQACAQFPVTFFEATTAAALLAYSRHPADLLILETGLGGRLDATNVVDTPALSIITPIGFDHQEFLGDSLAAIAGEKAGILKAGVACVLAPQEAQAGAAIGARAQQQGVTLIHAPSPAAQRLLGDVPPLGLAGAHQRINAACAVSAVMQLQPQFPVSDQAIGQGLAGARWPARLQRLSRGPLVDAWGARGAVYLDGAHNPAGAKALADWIRQAPQPVTLVLGILARKDTQGFLQALAGCVSRLHIVPVAGEQSAPPAALREQAQRLGLRASAHDSLEAAIAALPDDAAGTLLIAGSLYFAGQVLKNHSGEGG